MRKRTIIQLLLSLSGIFIVVLLFRQPKFIVEDEKKATLNDSPSQEKVDLNNTSHQSQIEEQDQRIIKSLTSKYLIENDLKKKSIFADSIAELYRKSFVFDGSSKYFEVAVALNPAADVLEKAALGVFEQWYKYILNQCR